MVSHDIDEVRQLCAEVSPITDGVTKEKVDAGIYYQQIKKQYEDLK